jgi:hypothetical protein
VFLKREGDVRYAHPPTPSLNKELRDKGYEEKGCQFYIIDKTLIDERTVKFINSKSEARSTKQIQMTKTKSFEHLRIRILNLFRISDFEFFIW